MEISYTYNVNIYIYIGLYLFHVPHTIHHLLPTHVPCVSYSYIPTRYFILMIYNAICSDGSSKSIIYVFICLWSPSWFIPEHDTGERTT